MIELNHERYMRQAITLAAQVPERPFAAIILDRVTGEVIAEGWNRSEENPTWHGEVNAINRLPTAPPLIVPSSSSIRRPSPARCARGQSSGPALDPSFSGHPSGFLSTLVNGRSTFMPRKLFDAARVGSA